MLTSLFTKNDKANNVLRNGTLVAGVRVAVKTTEAHTYSSSPTKLALESGALVSDHVILDPEVVAVTFSMTNAGEGRSAAKDAFDAFTTMLKTRQLVELVTEHAIYTNMCLVSLTPLHSAPYKGALSCTATFQKIYFVELVSAGRAPKQLKKSAQKTASGTEQDGKVEAKKVDTTQARRIADKAVENINKWLDF